MYSSVAKALVAQIPVLPVTLGNVVLWKNSMIEKNNYLLTSMIKISVLLNINKFSDQVINVIDDQLLLRSTFGKNSCLFRCEIPKSRYRGEGYIKPVYVRRGKNYVRRVNRYNFCYIFQRIRN